jgi:hypothetical protein
MEVALEAEVARVILILVAVAAVAAFTAAEQAQSLILNPVVVARVVLGLSKEV